MVQQDEAQSGGAWGQVALQAGLWQNDSSSVRFYSVCLPSPCHVGHNHHLPSCKACIFKARGTYSQKLGSCTRACGFPLAVTKSHRACVPSLFSHVWLSASPRTIACQALWSMGFSSQEYWSGVPLPSPGDLPKAGIEPMSLTCVSCIGRRVLYH